jgi:hypothetical protein
MENYGKLQRRFVESIPAKVFDRVNNVVNIDFQLDTQTDGKGNVRNGYSGYVIPIDGHTSDYSHVKSQLIEAAYPQKDEFGLVMNFSALQYDIMNGNLTMEDAAKTDDATAFGKFLEWRKLAASAAKLVTKNE